MRHGGSVWATPSVDAESGTLILTIGNPSPDHDGSARRGINLFTNAFVALDIRTGRLKWHFQQVHHDIVALGVGGKIQVASACPERVVYLRRGKGGEVQIAAGDLSGPARSTAG